jgi:hypothetical protein
MTALGDVQRRREDFTEGEMRLNAPPETRASPDRGLDGVTAGLKVRA